LCLGITCVSWSNALELLCTLGCFPWFFIKNAINVYGLISLNNMYAIFITVNASGLAEDQIAAAKEEEQS
jgi:hypothetical protein